MMSARTEVHCARVRKHSPLHRALMAFFFSLCFQVQCPFWPCFQRWPSTDRSPILYERRRIEFHPPINMFLFKLNESLDLLTIAVSCFNTLASDRWPEPEQHSDE